LAGEIVGERPAELERKNRLWALDRDYDRLQLDISRLLGDFSARWTLNTNSLPILYPPHTLPNLTEKDRIAVLWR
jgi:uracil-DNA glycosylase